MSAIKTVSFVALEVALWFGVMVLAVDALEFETTSRCKDCIILQHIRPELNAPAKPIVARADCAVTEYKKYRFCSGPKQEEL